MSQPPTISPAPTCVAVANRRGAQDGGPINFATLGYGLFLAVVAVLYWAIPRRAGRPMLFIASLVFYASWNVLYVPGFLALIVANYVLGLRAAGPRGRWAVVAAVAIDLGALGFFKYLDWLLGTSASALRLLGLDIRAPELGLILPLAISFVTFTMLAYVIDISRGRRPETRFTHFALFVTFFPHLIAGPIMRAHEFLPQVRHPRPFSMRYVPDALPLLVGGLLKKTLGDQLAPTAQAIFDAPHQYSTLGLWLGALAFAFQIYLDFSGYTDMALGSAALLGYRLPRNFDWPYRSLSIQEFWRRWHMTLSRWLRDYLYIPLGGSRHGTARTYAAIMTTMVLGGLWHGAGITFLVWGTWHGLGLAVNRWWRGVPRPAIPPALAWALTFLFVLVGWVWFRAGNVDAAIGYLRGMVVPHGGRIGVSPLAGALLLVGLAAQWPRWAELATSVAPSRSYRRYAVYGGAALFIVLMLPVTRIAFIYFQF